jgi:hypothetical protein
MTPQTITFASSPFWPVAIGFFGLGTGYFGGLSKGLMSHSLNSPITFHRLPPRIHQIKREAGCGRTHSPNDAGAVCSKGRKRSDD